MRIINIYKNYSLRRKAQKFFLLNYFDRVILKKKEFSHEKHRHRMVDYFNENFKELESTQLFNDITFSICKVLKPKQIHQVGCFTCNDSRFLQKKNIKTKFINSDFDKERVKFLKNKFKSFYFKVLDLENTSPENFNKDDLVLANAVLTNIQPEKLKSLISNIFLAKVKFLIIGDIYNKESLEINENSKSIPLHKETNYFHPYLSIAKQLNLQFFFIPDFIYTSYTVARGVFIVCKKKINIHNYLDHVLRSYLERQKKVLDKFEKTSINQHWKKSE
tara:strand:+ start:33761 stop:34588 length:828 start_codon:yes stop_codon:yes gene_type:complete